MNQPRGIVRRLSSLEIRMDQIEKNNSEILVTIKAAHLLVKVAAGLTTLASSAAALGAWLHR